MEEGSVTVSSFLIVLVSNCPGGGLLGLPRSRKKGSGGGVGVLYIKPNLNLTKTCLKSALNPGEAGHELE